MELKGMLNDYYQNVGIREYFNRYGVWNGLKRGLFNAIPFHIIKDYEIKNDTLYILEVRKNNVKYEYLINRETDSDKLIVFNNGAIAGGNVKYPVFQRHS